MMQLPCPRQQGLGGCEGAGTNSDTWEVFVSTQASVVPPRAGAGVGEVGEQHVACLLSGPRGQPACSSQAELGRPPTSSGARDSPGCLGERAEGAPNLASALPSLPPPPSHVLP